VRPIVVLLILGCVVSLSPGQWIEKVIPLPDSLSGLDGIGAIQFHAPNGALYVGGNKLIVVDAATREKRAGISLPGSIDIMCSSPASNKLYCASRGEKSIYSVDCAENRYLRAVRLASSPRAMCYAAAVNKVYVACPDSNLVGVVDCTADSLVATIRSLNGVRAICYNSDLNRVYAALSSSDEVAVIDCASDTLVRTIWVRGVEPADVCYDSISNCVYTANYTSATSSVIDCASDSVVRIVAVGDDPWSLLAGPQGKIYCGGDGPLLTVIDGGATRMFPVGYLYRWSYDPVNRKIYHASWGAYDLAVIDAVGDSVLVRVDLREGTSSLCFDPIGKATWVGGERATVSVIDGATDLADDTLLCGVFRPGVLRFNPVNNHVYCLEEGWNRPNNHLIVIDGDSNRVLKVLPAGGSCDSMIWNPVSNKLYISNSGDNTVSIVECTNDSIVATIDSREDWPNASCCSKDGKVYVCNDGYGVTVIDPVGDSVRKVIEVGHNPWGICYDRTDNKVYVGNWNGDSVRVIDVNSDSVVATVAVGFPYQSVCWNRSHNKVYVYGHNADSVAVIECAGDTVLRKVRVSTGIVGAFSDSLSDKVFFADAYAGNLRVVDAATDSFYKSLVVGSVGAMTDNGLMGSNHRLYVAGGLLTVVGIEADSILRRIQVGEEPSGVAWNSARSWVYVSNSASSSITVIRDTALVGVEETMNAERRTMNGGATVVRGELDFQPGRRQKAVERAELLDAGGRRVMELRPGTNDVRALAPGVYFIRTAQAQAQAQAIRKIVIAR
jgi:YVTN family beta-propeller protein